MLPVHQRVPCAWQTLQQSAPSVTGSAIALHADSGSTRHVLIAHRQLSSPVGVPAIASVRRRTAGGAAADCAGTVRERSATEEYPRRRVDRSISETRGVSRVSLLFVAVGSRLKQASNQQVPRSSRAGALVAVTVQDQGSLFAGSGRGRDAGLS